jgi:hypothetical protein
VRHLAGRGHCAGARRSWTPTCCRARTASCRPSRQYCCTARTALNQGQTEGRARRCLPRDRGVCACFHLTVQCLTTEALPAGIYANQTLEHVWPAAPRLTGPRSTSFTLYRSRRHPPREYKSLGHPPRFTGPAIHPLLSFCDPGSIHALPPPLRNSSRPQRTHKSNDWRTGCASLA